MPLFNTDYEGNVRGAVWDIGAYEYGTSTPVDTTPPSVSISAPSNGSTISGSVTVTAMASDAVGVVGVQFKLDGVNLGSEDTTSPYSVSWNTLTTTNASHVLTATARDAAGLSTSASVTITVYNAPTAPPTSPVLVAAYPFNEGSGTTVSDVSGNSHTGSLSGTGWTSGKYNNGLLFNGSSNYVLVPDAADLDFTTGLTLEAWVYPTSFFSGFVSVLVKQYVYFLYAHDGSGKVLGGVVIGGQNKVVSSSTPVSLNLWTHLALTYDGALLRLWINSAEAANVPATGSITTSTNPLWIGASNFGEYFPGKIDEVRLYNYALNQAAIQSDMNTPLGTVPDTTAPVISSVVSSMITSSSARITWTTNEASDTQVEYGLTTGYGSSSTLNAALTTSHQVDLVGLTPNTLHHYRVKSRDVANNLATGTDNNFTTSVAADVTAPVISSVSTTSITTTTTTVTWTTNEASDTQVEYGLTTSYGTSTTLVAALVTSHSTGLSGLEPFTLYHYCVKSRDGAGNLATGSDNTFTTLAVPDMVAPVISNVLNTNPTSTTTTVTWSTNELSTSQVEYGTTTSYGSLTTLDSGLVMSHSVNLSALASGSIYHYRVLSKDAANNLATSGDFTFVTALPPDTLPPTISNGAPSGVLPAGTVSATLSVNTNEAATCKYETSAGVPYASMGNTFSTTGGTTHSQTITGLVNGQTYTYYVRAQDAAGNVKTSDFVITFSVANSPTPPPSGSIVVNTPSGGEQWKVGQNKLIQWSSTGVSTNVIVKLIKDGTKTTVASNISNSGSLSWKPTGPKSQFCKIEVSTVDGSIVGTSNNFFIII